MLHKRNVDKIWSNIFTAEHVVSMTSFHGQHTLRSCIYRLHDMMRKAGGIAWNWLEVSLIKQFIICDADIDGN